MTKVPPAAADGKSLKGGRVWGLPFLTALAPSERYGSQRQKRHKKADRLGHVGRAAGVTVAAPGRKIIAVADSSFAAIKWLNAVRRRVCMITRLRLDARLLNPPARRRPGTVGRPPVIGKRQATLAERLADPKTHWRRLQVTATCVPLQCATTAPPSTSTHVKRLRPPAGAPIVFGTSCGHSFARCAGRKSSCPKLLLAGGACYEGIVAF